MVDHKDTMEKAFYTVAEAAEIIGLGRSMTYRLVKEGKLPSLKLGARRGLRIPVSGLRRWVEERTAEAEEGAASSQSHGSPI